LWPNLDVTEAMRDAALEALELLEAEHLRDRWVGEMSAGETRRIMIARALVHRPEMLLLDEPSNALDLAAQRELREILRRLAKNQEPRGTGILMVTHHLADILPEMDRVIMMRGGRIVGDGPKAYRRNARRAFWSAARAGEEERLLALLVAPAFGPLADGFVERNWGPRHFWDLANFLRRL
jgi:iron complex transport system ATP-binding protein